MRSQLPADREARRHERLPTFPLLCDDSFSEPVPVLSDKGREAKHDLLSLENTGVAPTGKCILCTVDRLQQLCICTLRYISHNLTSSSVV